MEEELLIETPTEEIIIDVPVVKKKRKSKEDAFRDAVIKRFSSAPWAKKRTVTLGGAGGIGSNLAYNLIKLGYDIILFEYDVVEAHNIGSKKHVDLFA